MNTTHKRILVVDDSLSIHEDFKKILELRSNGSEELDEMEDFLFEGKKPSKDELIYYSIDDAYQGEEAIEMVNRANVDGFPYSLIFMDVRMPPGIDGIETISRIWKNHPNIEMVICTAYSDYTWDEILEKFGETDKLLFTKKPFNIVSIKQLALALTTKWEIAKKNREYYTMLEEEVKRRTLELEKLLEHMKVLKEKAEASDKMKSTFLANMSHEIRNPLNTILGFTELLELDSQLSAEKRMMFVKSINKSGKSLLRLINDIIDLAKIEAGHLKMINEPFNLNVLFHELQKFFTLEAENKSNEVDLVVDALGQSENFIINSDQTRIRQILSNLLHNAIKFTNKGFIKFGFKKINTKQIAFYVQDTGVGIDKEQQKLIFERFMQADVPNQQHTGTGLGLAIANNLVKMLGGNLELESEAGKGSNFHFTLPLEQIGEKENSSGLGNKDNRPQYDWQGKTILIAEDEEDNFMFLAEVLLNTQITIERAKNGLEAIEIYDSKPIDLVLTDVRMPERDGYEVLQHIRAKDKNAIIIAQSAFAMVEEKRKYLELGFNDYIEKPINIQRMLTVLDSYIIR